MNEIELIVGQLEKGLSDKKLEEISTVYNVNSMELKALYKERVEPELLTTIEIKKKEDRKPIIIGDKIKITFSDNSTTLITFDKDIVEILTGDEI